MNKKIIVIMVLWNVLILLALGWSLMQILGERIATGMYMEAVEAAGRVSISLKEKIVSLDNENKFLKMQLKEFGHFVPEETYESTSPINRLITRKGFWTIRLASYLGYQGESALNEIMINTFIKNKMFDVVFRTEHNVTVLCYGRYETELEAVQQLERLKSLHNDFKGCAVERFKDELRSLVFW